MDTFIELLIKIYKIYFNSTTISNQQSIYSLNMLFLLSFGTSVYQDECIFYWTSEELLSISNRTSLGTVI